VGHKKEHDNVVLALNPSWEAAKNTAERLKTQLFALQAKLGEAKRMQAVWAARQRAAEVQQTLERTLAKVKSLSDSASALPIQATFSQAVDKIKIMEAKAKALAEMFNADSQPEQDGLAIDMARTIESELAEIEIKVQSGLLTQQEQPLIPELQEAPSGTVGAKLSS
jgi:phage shock protein A